MLIVNKNLKTPEICQKGAKAIKPGPTMIWSFMKVLALESIQDLNFRLGIQTKLHRVTFFHIS